MYFAFCEPKTVVVSPWDSKLTVQELILHPPRHPALLRGVGDHLALAPQGAPTPKQLELLAYGEFQLDRQL